MSFCIHICVLDFKKEMSSNLADQKRFFKANWMQIVLMTIIQHFPYLKNVKRKTAKIRENLQNNDFQQYFRCNSERKNWYLLITCINQTPLRVVFRK